MKVVIIEDEELAANSLKKQLVKADGEIQILNVINSVKTGKDWFANNQLPDLIISDIQLLDGSSFQIFEDLGIKAPVIFTTAYDAYALRAFKINSIDYLLKPIDQQELERSIQKFKSSHYLPIASDLLAGFIKESAKEKQKKYKERFLASFKNSYIPVHIDFIHHFCKDTLIYIYTNDEKKLISDCETLDEVEELVDPEIFYRANRQYVIHISSVEKVTTTHKGITVKLNAPYPVEIDISREKATEFKSWLGR
jgi:two-component system, LytTR family, response regulator